MEILNNPEGSSESYLKIISDLALTLIQQTTPEEVVWAMARQVSLALGFYDCVIYLFDEDQQLLIQKAAYGPKNPHPFQLKDPISLPIGQGIVGSVAQSRRAEIIHDTRPDSRYVVDDAVRHSEITVPILFEDNLLGIIDSEHPDANFFTPVQLEVPQTLASMSATRLMQARAWESLQVQTQRLKLSNHRLLQFAYMASHDLRSPVSNIVSLLDLLDTKDCSAETQLLLTKIGQASQRLARNLDQLIELVTDEDSLYRKSEKVAFAPLLEEVKQSIAKQVEDSQATILTDFQVDAVEYPSVYLRSILQNLLTNAIKYRSPLRLPYIRVSTNLADSYVCLSVEDNGKGIDLAKNQLKIFGRLSRFDDEADGKGLGLYVVKTQVEALGGKIEVESQLGKGSVFSVYLSRIGKRSDLIGKVARIRL